MNVNLIHFVDFETVPFWSGGNIKKLSAPPVEYTKRFAHQVEGEAPELMKHFLEHAALYGEHCKIVSVSIGKMVSEKFFIKTICGDDEVAILKSLAELLENAKTKPTTLGGHNIIEFDVPIAMRRFLINGLPLPGILNNFDRKPWESPYKDTMKMWSGTQWNYKVSLDLLCHCFGLPSPKKIMSGSSVADLFYSEDVDRLKKIGDYNAGDVLAAANVYCRMTGQELIDESKVVVV